MSTRVKQRNKLFRVSIAPGNIGTFVKIASKTTERQIAGNSSTTVLFSDDVVDGKAVERIVVLAHEAILAPTAGPFAHQLLKRLIHGDRSSWPTEFGPWISESK